MKEVEKKAILKLLEDAEKDKFFGEITFKLRDGKIYQIVKGQSLMLEQLTES
jgi:uncharacterized protein YjgD (DUF1641 family)